MSEQAPEGISLREKLLKENPLMSKAQIEQALLAWQIDNGPKLVLFYLLEPLHVWSEGCQHPGVKQDIDKAIEEIQLRIGECFDINQCKFEKVITPIMKIKPGG